MALDFRASQFRGAKFISSGSTGTGAKIIFYDIAQDSTSTPNQGSLNLNLFGTGSIGTDIFLYVSGTETSGSSTSRISTFGGSVFISGSLALKSKTNADQLHISPADHRILVVYPSGSGYNEDATWGIAAITDGTDFSVGTPAFHIQSATVRASGSGGDLNLRAGDGGYRGGLNQSAPGGNIAITAGEGGFIGGGGSSPASAGGSITLTGGAGIISENSRTGGAGGDVSIVGGIGGESLGGIGGSGGDVSLIGGVGYVGSTEFGDGGHITLTGGDVDPTGAGPGALAGNIRLSPGENYDGGTVGYVLVSAPQDTSIRGTDEFLCVSGTIATGSTGRISSFHGSVKVSGSIGFSNTIYMKSVGSDLKFWDGNNNAGWTLTQLAASGAATPAVYWYSPSNAVVATSGSMQVTGSATFGQSIFVTGTIAHTNNVSASNHGVRVETVLTTDATPGTLWSFPLETSKMYDVDMSIVAVGTDPSITKRFKRNLAVMNFSGTGSILENTVFAPVLDVSGSTTVNTADVGFTVSGAYIITTVTGVASQGIKWTMKAEYTFGAAYVG